MLSSKLVPTFKKNDRQLISDNLQYDIIGKKQDLKFEFSIAVLARHPLPPTTRRSHLFRIPDQEPGTHNRCEEEFSDGNYLLSFNWVRTSQPGHHSHSPMLRLKYIFITGCPGLPWHHLYLEVWENRGRICAKWSIESDQCSAQQVDAAERFVEWENNLYFPFVEIKEWLSIQHHCDTMCEVKSVFRTLSDTACGNTFFPWNWSRKNVQTTTRIQYFRSPECLRVHHSRWNGIRNGNNKEGSARWDYSKKIFLVLRRMLLPFNVWANFNNLILLPWNSTIHNWKPLFEIHCSIYFFENFENNNSWMFQPCSCLSSPISTGTRADWCTMDWER